MMLTTDIRGEAVLARLRGTEDKLRRSLRAEVLRQSIEVQAAVKAEKLTGQVLHVRTGTLRRSINRRIDETPDSIIATVGTNVAYARVHEYGFTGTVNIRQHARTITQAWGKPLAAPMRVQVRAHTAKVKLPARSFLRSTLQDKEQRIVAGLREAALRGMEP